MGPVIKERVEMETLENLPKIYHGTDCLRELWTMHEFLAQMDERSGKKLRDAMAREKIARSGLGLSRKRGRRAVPMVEGQREEKQSAEKKQKRESTAMMEEGAGTGHGQLLSGQPGAAGPSATGSPQQQQVKPGSGLMGIDLDEDFLKTLERLAEGSSGGQLAPAMSGSSAAAASVSAEEAAELPEVTEWRRRFQEVLAMRYAKSERIRFLFCRKMYGHYVERMRQINRLKPELRTCKEKRLIRKFDLDKEERTLLDRNSRKPYLCYEDIFDAIYNCHMESDVNEMRMLFSKLKDQFANITFECVLEYFKVRDRQQQQLNQWASVDTPRPSSENHQQSISPLPSAAMPLLVHQQQPYFLKNSSGSEDEGDSKLQLNLAVANDAAEADGGKMSANDQLSFSRSKYRTMFSQDEQGSVYCQLCPFMLTASSSNQTYQKIRNHIRYNHNHSWGHMPITNGGNGGGGAIADEFKMSPV